MAFSDITLSAFLQQAELIEQYSAPQSAPHQRHVPKTPPLPDDVLPPHRIKAAEIVQQFFGDAPAYVPRLKSREHPRPEGAPPSITNASQSILLPPLIPASRRDAVSENDTADDVTFTRPAVQSVELANETQPTTQPALFDAYETLAAMAAPPPRQQQRAVSASPRAQAVPAPRASSTHQEPSPADPGAAPGRSGSSSPPHASSGRGAGEEQRGKRRVSPQREGQQASASAVPDVGKLLASAGQSQAVRAALAAAVPELRVILERLQQRGALPAPAPPAGRASAAAPARKSASSRSPSPQRRQTQQAAAAVPRPAGRRSSVGRQEGAGAAGGTKQQGSRKSVSPQRGAAPAVKAVAAPGHNIGPIATQPSSPGQASVSAASFVSRIPVLKGGRRSSTTAAAAAAAAAGAGGGAQPQENVMPSGEDVVTSVEAAIDSALHASVAPPTPVKRVEMEVQTDAPRSEGNAPASSEVVHVRSAQLAEDGDAGAALLAELTQAIPVPAAPQPRFTFSPSAGDIPALESALAAAEADKARALRNLRAAEEQLRDSLPTSGEGGKAQEASRSSPQAAARKVALWHALMTDREDSLEGRTDSPGGQGEASQGRLPSPVLDPVAQRLAAVQRTLAAAGDGVTHAQSVAHAQPGPAPASSPHRASESKQADPAQAVLTPAPLSPPACMAQVQAEEKEEEAVAQQGVVGQADQSQGEAVDPVDARLRAVERRYMAWKGVQADKARVQEAVFAALRSGSAIQAAQAPASVSTALQQALASARAQALKQPRPAAAVEQPAVVAADEEPGTDTGGHGGMDGLISALSLVQHSTAHNDSSQLLRTLQPAVGPQPSDRPRGAPYPEPLSPAKPAQAAVARLGAGKGFQDPFAPGGDQPPALAGASHSAPTPSGAAERGAAPSASAGSGSRLDALVSSLASADLALTAAQATVPPSHSTVRLAPRSQAPASTRLVPDPVLQHSPMAGVHAVPRPGGTGTRAEEGDTLSTVSKQEDGKEEGELAVASDGGGAREEGGQGSAAVVASPPQEGSRSRTADGGGGGGAGGLFSPQPAPPLHESARAERPARHQRAGAAAAVIATASKTRSRSPSKRGGRQATAAAAELDNSTLSGYMDRSMHAGRGSNDALASVLGVMQAGPPAAPTPSLPTSSHASLLLSTALGQPRERALLRPNGGTYRPTGTLQGISMAASLPYILQPLGMSARLQ